MRIGYFTRGSVLGSQDFLANFKDPQKENINKGHPLKGVDSRIRSQRNLRKNIIS